MTVEVRADRAIQWPSLPLEEWADTQATLQLWLQVVGKVRLALSPMANHWWQTPLYLTARGLTTSPIPHGPGVFQVDLDFVDHRLLIQTSEGGGRTLPLAPRPVADFYADLMAALRVLGIDVEIWTTPVELENPIPFEEDRTHRAYDADAAHRWWRVLLATDRALKAFGSGFLGKVSPVHLFWGSFDLAQTRFSGRRAPQFTGAAPNVAPHVMHESYSHEVISAGFWPGTLGGPVPYPAFYTYAVPTPEGFAEAPAGPATAFYSKDLGEFVLPYEAVRTADHPEETLLDFLRSTYVAGATLGGWDRALLEERPPCVCKTPPKM